MSLKGLVLFVLLFLVPVCCHGRYFYVVKDGTLLFKRPWVGSEPLLSLDVGDRIFPRAKRRGWLLVRAKGKLGWIRRSCVVSLPVKLALNRVEPRVSSLFLRVLGGFKRGFFEGIRAVYISRSFESGTYRLFIRVSDRIRVVGYGGESFLDLLPMQNYLSTAFILRQALIYSLGKIPYSVLSALRVSLIVPWKKGWFVVLAASRFGGYPVFDGSILLCRDEGGKLACFPRTTDLEDFLKRFFLFHLGGPSFRDGIISSRKKRVASEDPFYREKTSLYESEPSYGGYGVIRACGVEPAASTEKG